MREFMKSLRVSWQQARFGAGYEVVERQSRFYWWAVLTNLVMLWWPVIYEKSLRRLHLAERRCSWCKKFLGWRFGVKGPGLGIGIMVTHGICAHCQVGFEAEAAQPVRVRRPRWKQTPLRSTLRRRTGGWSGAVALRGRVAHSR